MIRNGCAAPFTAGPATGPGALIVAASTEEAPRAITIKTTAIAAADERPRPRPDRSRPITHRPPAGLLVLTALSGRVRRSGQPSGVG
jgi:hypothetical protein